MEVVVSCVTVDLASANIGGGCWNLPVVLATSILGPPREARSHLRARTSNSHLPYTRPGGGLERHGYDLSVGEGTVKLMLS